MRGLIILDGPDAVGKTTLANRILGGDMSGYIHLTYDPNWDDPDRTLWRMQYFTLIKAAWRFSRGLMTVIDRHWMSEQIYARVYRDGSTMNGESRGWDRVIQTLCGVYVICAPDPNSATLRHAKTLQEREEMYAADDKILQVATAYYNLWHGTPFNETRDYFQQLSGKGMKKRFDAVHYDIDTQSSPEKMDDVIAEIYTRLAGLKSTQYQAPFVGQPNYLGHPRKAEFIFVGEQINPKKTGRWPFIDYGASSRAISDVLNELRFDEQRAIWTNAIADDHHVGKLLAYYPDLKIIALGGKAWSQLTNLGHPVHGQVFHPAYAKRFNEMDQLREQLRIYINE
jgi:hypothetical protein